MSGRAAPAALARTLAAAESTTPSDLRLLGLAIRARALLALGRPDEALLDTRAGIALLDVSDVDREGEAMLRLVHAEALHATGAAAQAHAAIAAARAWVLDKAARVENPDWRRSFMDRLDENKRIFELARAWGVPER